MKTKLLSVVLLLLWLLAACGAPIEIEPVESLDTEIADDESMDEVSIEEPEPLLEAATESEDAAATLPPPTDIPEPTAAAPSPTEAPPTAENTLADSLPRISKAPDIINETWLNSEPMTLAGQEGKVVLVEFWTYT